MNKKTNTHLPGNRLFAAGLHWVPERDLGVRNYKVAAQVFQHPLSQIFYMGFQNIAIDGKQSMERKGSWPECVVRKHLIFPGPEYNK
jgi:hypothetical protein